jgi:signal transduction histidine kinase
MKLLTMLRPRTVVFPLAFVAALAMLIISEAAHWQSVVAVNEQAQRAGARTGLQDLQQSILDAETGQRGYLLTGRPEHLRPYDEALQQIGAEFARLDAYYAVEPEPTAVLGELHTLTAAKLKQLALEVRERKPLRGAVIGDIALSDIGREQMTAIRTLAGELLAHEAQRDADGRQALYQTMRLGRIGVAALSMLSLMALFLYLRQTAALKQQQLTLKTSVQAERDRLDIEVRRRTAQLTELTQHLQTAREDERHRLARNLHDELGALLTSAKLDAARIKSRLAGTSPEALERLAHLVGTLNQSIALGRSIIEDLRPSTLGNLGLVPTLEILAREFSELAGVDMHCELTPVRLDANAELMVYRLVQEAITNISKYAHARHAWVSLGTRGGQVEVSVRDDGVGFDTSIPPTSAYGLVGMRFRVEAEGGMLTVRSAPGQGTSLRVTLPESAQEREPAAGLAPSPSRQGT